MLVEMHGDTGARRMLLEPGELYSVQVGVPTTLPDSGPVFFDIVVQNEMDGKKWHVTRRYQAFDALANELELQQVAMSAGAFPPKRPSPNRDMGQLLMRAALLEAWSIAVLRDQEALALPAVVSFFGFDAPRNISATGLADAQCALVRIQAASRLRLSRKRSSSAAIPQPAQLPNPPPCLPSKNTESGGAGGANGGRPCCPRGATAMSMVALMLVATLGAGYMAYTTTFSTVSPLPPPKSTLGSLPWFNQAEVKFAPPAFTARGPPFNVHGPRATDTACERRPFRASKVATPEDGRRVCGEQRVLKRRQWAKAPTPKQAVGAALLGAASAVGGGMLLTQPRVARLVRFLGRRMAARAPSPLGGLIALPPAPSLLALPPAPSVLTGALETVSNQMQVLPFQSRPLRGLLGSQRVLAAVAGSKLVQAAGAKLQRGKFLRGGGKFRKPRRVVVPPPPTTTPPPIPEAPMMMTAPPVPQSQRPPTGQKGAQGGRGGVAYVIASLLVGMVLP